MTRFFLSYDDSEKLIGNRTRAGVQLDSGRQGRRGGGGGGGGRQFRLETLRAHDARTQCRARCRKIGQNSGREAARRAKLNPKCHSIVPIVAYHARYSIPREVSRDSASSFSQLNEREDGRDVRDGPLGASRRRVTSLAQVAGRSGNWSLNPGNDTHREPKKCDSLTPNQGSSTLGSRAAHYPPGDPDIHANDETRAADGRCRLSGNSTAIRVISNARAIIRRVSYGDR